MPRAHITIAIIASLSMLGGCCGYGGPGCHDPAIVGLCGSQVGLGEVSATVVFGDDTGFHPSKFGPVTTEPDKNLVARHGEEIGDLILVGRALGPATLVIDGAEGWEQTQFRWPLDVVSEVDTFECELEFEDALFPQK